MFFFLLLICLHSHAYASFSRTCIVIWKIGSLPEGWIQMMVSLDQMNVKWNWVKWLDRNGSWLCGRSDSEMNSCAYIWIKSCSKKSFPNMIQFISCLVQKEFSICIKAQLPSTSLFLITVTDAIPVTSRKLLFRICCMLTAYFLLHRIGRNNYAGGKSACSILKSDVV